MDRLILWWERAKLGTGTTILIKGEAGIGKTALAKAFINRIEVENTYVLQADGYEEEIGPLIPFIEAIHKFLTEHMKEFNKKFIIEYISNLSHIVPGLHSLISSFQYSKEKFIDERISEFMPTKEVQIFFDFISFFEGLSKRKPVVLFLEDIQWLDRSSRKLFFYLLKRISNHPILIIATYRTHFITSDTEKETDEFIHHLEGSIRDRVLETIELLPIPEEKFHILLENLLQATNNFSTENISFLYEQTEGNPKYLFELLNLLEESGIIQQRDGDFVFTQSKRIDEIPKTIERIISNRLHQIYNDLPQSKDILEFASIMGFRFRTDKLEGLIGKSMNEILEILSTVERKYYLVKRYKELFQYMFDHKKTQEVIYCSLGNAAPDLHRHLAEYLENEGTDPYRIAYHYQKGLDYKKASNYFLISAEQALKNGNYDDSIAFYEEAFLIERGKFDVEPNISKLINYAKALFLGYRIEKALNLFLQIFQQNDKLSPLEAARLHSYLGKCYYTDGRYSYVEKSFPHLKKAIELYYEIGELKEVLDSSFDLAASYDHIGAYNEVQATVDVALDIAKSISDPIELANAFRRSYIAYDYRSKSETLKKAIADLQAAGEERSLARLYNNLGVELARNGSFGEAFMHMKRSLSLFENLHVFEIDFPSNNLGVLYLIEGDYPMAKMMLMKALDHHSEEFNKISALSNLAFISAIENNASQFTYYSNQILHSLKNFSDPWLTEKCYLNLAICFNKMGHSAEAHHYIVKAMGIDTSGKKGDKLSIVKATVFAAIEKKHCNHDRTHQLVEEMDSPALPPLFKVSGFYPCLISFFY